MSLDYEQEVLTEKLQMRISEVGCKKRGDGIIILTEIPLVV